MTVRLAALTVVSLTLAGLISAPAARAGEYHVYSCRTPSGEVAPVDGWSGSAGPTYDDYAKNTCAQGGALTAALGDVSIHDANVDVATWTFNTPGYDRMVGATLWRAGDADGGAGFNASYQLWLAGPSNNGIFDECVYQSGCTAGVGDPAQPLDGANRVVVPSASLGAHLYFSAGCGGNSEFQCPAGKGDTSGYAAAVNLYAADIVLEQSAGPTASDVGGELASEKTVQGTSDLIFSASDPGAGVWEATFSIDGKLVQSTVPNENGGRCRNVGQTTDGLAAFLYLHPCLASESVDVGFDTTAVSNGDHHLVVSVIDPAGNSAPVLDKQIDVENGPPAAPASPAVPVKPGRRRLPRARVTLSVKPHKVSLRQSIHFKGRLLGGHIPKIGKLLVLEARLVRGRTSRGRRRSARCGTSCGPRSGKWFGFDEIRTGRQGRVHGSYRFNMFVGPGDYELRVLAKAETGYPFSAGTSNVVRVRVA